jgi:hypothetical protein
MSDYEQIKMILTESGHSVSDSEAGIPRRHFLTTNGVVFRFEPDGSLAEVFPGKSEAE